MLKQFLTELGSWVMLTWLPLFIHDTYHFTLGKSGFQGTLMLSGAIVLGMAVGGSVFDWVGIRLPRQRMLVVGLYYVAAAPFCLVFLFHPSYHAVFAAVSIFSLIRGMATASERPLLCDFIPAGYRSTVFGFYNAVANVGGGAGVFLTGWYKGGFGLHTAFAALSVLYLGAALAMFLGHFVFIARDIRRAQAYGDGVT